MCWQYKRKGGSIVTLRHPPRIWKGGEEINSPAAFPFLPSLSISTSRPCGSMYPQAKAV